MIIVLCVTMITMYARESDSGPIHKVQDVFMDVISPISSGFSKVFKPIKDGFVNVFRLPTLARDNAELEKKVDQLRRENIEAVELEKELEELKKLLNWGEEHPEMETVGTDIIAQSPDNWQRLMVIKKGSSSNVQKYMAVVSASGMVGRIISVGTFSSVVQLITDSRSGVGARVQRSRETGIIEGMNSDVLRLVPMNEEADLKVGDIIETSGLGGTVPAGIAIGKISKIKKRTEGLSELVEVEPFVEFSKLSDVLVIITPEPESVILKGTQ
ncbi:MAG: rod shape-determining protein MreC [Actinobacteria bacterium]|nr:rod shape-determining protein MreC [Actinomycetota bacterium]